MNHGDGWFDMGTSIVRGIHDGFVPNSSLSATLSQGSVAINEEDKQKTGVLTIRAHVSRYEREHIGDIKSYSEDMLHRTIVQSISDGRPYLVKIFKTQIRDGSHDVHVMQRALVLLVNHHKCEVGESCNIDGADEESYFWRIEGKSFKRQWIEDCVYWTRIE